MVGFLFELRDFVHHLFSTVHVSSVKLIWEDGRDDADHAEKKGDKAVEKYLIGFTYQNETG